MKVVVTTPTGNVGSRVVRLLLQAGVTPTLLLRHPERLDPAVRSRAEVVQADQRDADAVVHATRGADALYWVDPPTGEDDPVAASARLGAVAARAVSANRVARTVFQSSVGAGRRTGAGMIDGLARVETQLDATGATVLHLRCGYFATNLLGDLDALRGGTLPTTMPPDLPLPWSTPGTSATSPWHDCCPPTGRAARCRPSTAPRTSRSTRSPASSASPADGRSAPSASATTSCARPCPPRG